MPLTCGLRKLNVNKVVPKKVRINYILPMTKSEYIRNSEHVKSYKMSTIESANEHDFSTFM